MRIACLLDSGFEDDEFRTPYDAFTAAGHEVVVIGFKAHVELKGLHGKVTGRTDRGIDDVNSSDFDALLLPGGSSPDHLRADPRMVAFTEAFFTRDRPVFAVTSRPPSDLDAFAKESLDLLDRAASRHAEGADLHQRASSIGG